MFEVTLGLSPGLLALFHAVVLVSYGALAYYVWLIVDANVFGWRRWSRWTWALVALAFAAAAVGYEVATYRAFYALELAVRYEDESDVAKCLSDPPFYDGALLHGCESKGGRLNVAPSTHALFDLVEHHLVLVENIVTRTGTTAISLAFVLTAIYLPYYLIMKREGVIAEALARSLSSALGGWTREKKLVETTGTVATAAAAAVATATVASRNDIQGHDENSSSSASSSSS